jgi:hypothetical protein
MRNVDIEVWVKLETFLLKNKVQFFEVLGEEFDWKFAATWMINELDGFVIL